MIEALCPHCGGVLQIEEACWRCEQGHCFDVARQGYVNLLPVERKHSLHPGDTKEQVAARKRFLDAGYYTPIAEAVKKILQAEAPKTILDAGCGEGYYLTQAAPQRAECWGVDISKDAVRYAAVRNKNARWLVGTAAHLPFADGAFDCVISMFALTAAEEFHRVLRPGGLFMQVIAHPAHLTGLKSVIYPELLHKQKQTAAELLGFSLAESRLLEFEFTLDSREAVADLLSMTPHFWRITKEGAARAAETDYLQDTARVILNLYRSESNAG